MKRLRHHKSNETLADFLYEVDARGNRTKATELLRQSGAIMSTTTIAHDDASIEYGGTWSAVGSFHETTAIGATLRLEFLGNTNVELTMGEGDDHSIYDVYINETLWQSYDGYASISGERVIEIPHGGCRYFWRFVRNCRDILTGYFSHFNITLNIEFTTFSLTEVLCQLDFMIIKQGFDIGVECVQSGFGIQPIISHACIFS